MMNLSVFEAFPQRWVVSSFGLSVNSQKVADTQNTYTYIVSHHIQLFFFSKDSKPLRTKLEPVDAQLTFW